MNQQESLLYFQFCRWIVLRMITHDLGVVAEVCTKVVVMYLGQVIEEASVEFIFTSPLHPYTQGLLKSIPHIEGPRDEKLYVSSRYLPFQSNKNGKYNLLHF